MPLKQNFQEYNWGNLDVWLIFTIELSAKKVIYINCQKILICMKCNKKFVHWDFMLPIFNNN